jgi:hypothetical protein
VEIRAEFLLNFMCFFEKELVADREKVIFQKSARVSFSKIQGFQNLIFQNIIRRRDFV